MMTMETFQTWRHETAAELDEAKQALAAATEQLAATEGARDLAKAEQLRIRAMLGSLPQPVPALLTACLQPSEHALRKAEGALTMAKQNVVNSRHLVEDLQEALDRLASVLTSDEPQEVVE
jgi:chromosome segregation ATPase